MSELESQAALADATAAGDHQPTRQRVIEELIQELVLGADDGVLRRLTDEMIGAAVERQLVTRQVGTEGVVTGSAVQAGEAAREEAREPLICQVWPRRQAIAQVAPVENHGVDVLEVREMVVLCGQTTENAENLVAQAVTLLLVLQQAADAEGVATDRRRRPVPGPILALA